MSPARPDAALLTGATGRNNLTRCRLPTQCDEGERMPPTTVYGHRRTWGPLHEQIVTSAPDLRGRLEALVQAAHAGASPADVEAVQSALFAAADTAVMPAI
jgi:hypothetical protein